MESGSHVLFLIPKNYWKKKRRLCVKFFELTNTTWENLQIATHKSVSFTLHIELICALQFADFVRLCLSPRTTSPTISISTSNFFFLLIWFLFSILAQHSLSFARVYSTLLGSLQGCTCRCLKLLSLRAVTSNPSLFPNANPLSNGSVIHDGREHKTVVFLQSNTVRDKHARCTNLPLFAIGCRRWPCRRFRWASNLAFQRWRPKLKRHRKIARSCSSSSVSIRLRYHVSNSVVFVLL